MRRYILAVTVILGVFLAAYFLWKSPLKSGSENGVAADVWALPPFELVEKSGGGMLPRESLGTVSIEDYNPIQKGQKQALSVVMWADLTHPDLAHAVNLKRVMTARFGKRLSWVFKHLPQDQDCNPTSRVTRNPDACELSAIAQCVGDDFWGFVELLAKNPGRTDQEMRRLMLGVLGSDVEAVEECASFDATKGQLLRDIEDAQSLGMGNQSKILVGGVPLPLGSNAPSLDALIRAQLGETSINAEGGLPIRRFFPAQKTGLTGTQDMVEVDGFYMDAVEGMLAKDGSTRSVAGMLPAALSWTAADASCRKSGKRMCTEAEFRRACSGRSEWPILRGRSWPYAQLWMSNICWDSGSRQRSRGYETGQKAHCRSPEGVYDLTGNHWEWVGATPEKAVLVGGSYLDGESATCGARLSDFGVEYAAPWVSFRCCADESVAATGAGVVLDHKRPSFALPDEMSGQIAVVHVVSSDCGSCVRPTAMLKDLLVEEPDWGLLLVVVGSEEASVSALDSADLKAFEIWPDPSAKTAGELGVLDFPTTVVFDATGGVLSRMDGFSAKGWSQIRAALR